MTIQNAEFITSSTRIEQCPLSNKPEFAFIGRSNVGKSSLINMLTNRKSLAKTSSTPGKTQTINHFMIDKKWYLVDLPGYGYASTSRDARKSWELMIENYLLNRTHLFCTFLLIDIRIEPQESDLQFIQWLGESEIPIALVMTKSDKLKQAQIQAAKTKYESILLESWETLPPIFLTSAETRIGRKEVLNFIDEAIRSNEKV